MMIFRIVVPVLRINNQQEKEETDFPWKEMKWLIYIFKQKPGREQTFELDESDAVITALKENYWCTRTADVSEYREPSELLIHKCWAV